MLLKLLLVFIVIIDLTELCRSADSRLTKNEDPATSSSTVSQEQTSMPLFMKGHHYVIQGNEQMRAGDPKKALRSYNKAIEKNSKRWSYFGLRGLCLMELNKVGSALEDFETAVQMAKNPQNNDTKPSLMNDVELIKMGDILCEAKRYDLAILCFNEAGKMAPINAHRALGQCYMRMGEWKLAMENFTPVVEENPRNTDDRKLLSQALLENGDFKGALKEIMEVDDTGEELVKIGDDLKYTRKNSEEALKFYDNAIEKSPNNALYYIKRGKCLLDMKEYDKAVSNFSEALNLDPQIEDGHNCLTEALFYSGQRNEALKESAKLSSSALEILGRKFLHKEKFDEALDCFNNALEKHSESAFVLEGRAICHRKLGNLDIAISDMMKSLSIRDDNWPLRLDLCELFLETNSNFEAEEVLTRIEKHSSDHPYYWPSSAKDRIEMARQTLHNRQLRGELKETHENSQPEPTTPSNPSSDGKNPDDNPFSEYLFPNL